MDRWTDKENREYLRTGTIAAHALNPYRDNKFHPAPFTAFDIFPHLPKPPPVQITPAEAANNMRRMFEAMDRAKNRRQKRSARPAKNGASED